MIFRLIHRDYGNPYWGVKHPAHHWLFIHLGMWCVIIFIKLRKSVK